MEFAVAMYAPCCSIRAHFHHSSTSGDDFERMTKVCALHAAHSDFSLEITEKNSPNIKGQVRNRTLFNVSCDHVTPFFNQATQHEQITGCRDACVICR
jgi:hypothetical protein